MFYRIVVSTSGLLSSPTLPTPTPARVNNNIKAWRYCIVGKRNDIDTQIHFIIHYTKYLAAYINLKRGRNVRILPNKHMNYAADLIKKYEKRYMYIYSVISSIIIEYWTDRCTIIIIDINNR